MEQSKVYFSDLRAPVGTNLLRKLEKLIRRAGIGDIDMEKKLVAIKLHFGEAISPISGPTMPRWWPTW